MVVPYKVDTKSDDTDTQVKKYLNELSKARSFQTPGLLNDQIENVKQPAPITQATVYNSLEGLIKELKSKNASDPAIKELTDTIKTLKEEVAVKPELNVVGDINAELKETVSALRETSAALNEMIKTIRNQTEKSNIKEEEMDIDKAEKLRDQLFAKDDDKDADDENDIKADEESGEKYEDASGKPLENTANSDEALAGSNIATNQTKQTEEDKKYVRKAEEELYKASVDLGEKK